MLAGATAETAVNSAGSEAETRASACVGAGAGTGTEISGGSGSAGGKGARKGSGAGAGAGAANPMLVTFTTAGGADSACSFTKSSSFVSSPALRRWTKFVMAACLFAAPPPGADIRSRAYNARALTNVRCTPAAPPLRLGTLHVAHIQQSHNATFTTMALGRIPTPSQHKRKGEAGHNQAALQSSRGRAGGCLEKEARGASEPMLLTASKQQVICVRRQIAKRYCL